MSSSTLRQPWRGVKVPQAQRDGLYLIHVAENSADSIRRASQLGRGLLPNGFQLHTHEAHGARHKEQIWFGEGGIASFTAFHVVDELLPRDAIFDVVLTLLSAVEPEAVEAMKSRKEVW